MLNTIAASIVVILGAATDAHGNAHSHEVHAYTADEQTLVCRSSGSFCLSPEETAYTGAEWAYERTVNQ